MTNFTATESDTSPISSVLRGATDNIPVTLAKWIQTAQTAGSDNDLASVLAAYAVKLAEHNSADPSVTEGALQTDIAVALDHGRWAGTFNDNTTYAIHKEVKESSKYYRAKLQVNFGGGVPSTNTTGWVELTGFDKEVAQFHEFLSGLSTSIQTNVDAIATNVTSIAANATAIAALPTDDDLDEFREDIDAQIRGFASHQEVVVHELPDPTGALSPEYAYLSNKWTPEQGFSGHEGEVDYSHGEYRLTTGDTANRAKVQFGRTTVELSGSQQPMIGFMQRAARLEHHGNPIADFGTVFHNPAGGACPALYFGKDPGNVTFRAAQASWIAWVKTSLARHAANPWNLPTTVEAAQFVARIYHDSTHFDILLQMTVTETVDGIDYTRCVSGQNPQPGRTWVNALDLTDEAASTVEIEFRTSNSSTVLWLGDETMGWTWVDPTDDPTAISRIDRIERATMAQGELLASMTKSGSGSLDDVHWTIETVDGVTHGNSEGSGDGSWSKYLYFNCDEFAQALDGSHGILVVVERSSAVVSSVFVPWSQFATNWASDHEFFAGKWETGGTGDNKVVFASCGVNSNRLHLRLACAAADGTSTARIYRNN